MRMPTSTSRHTTVSVETTASGTTVRFSISTAPTRPTRDSWLLLLPSRRERRIGVEGKEKRMLYLRSFKFLSRLHFLVRWRLGKTWLVSCFIILVASCYFSLPSAVAKAEDCLSELNTAGRTGWKIGPNKLERSIVHTKRFAKLLTSFPSHAASISFFA